MNFKFILIIVKSVKGERKMSELRRHIMMQQAGGGVLPDEYQQVEYVLTYDGYINLGLLPYSKLRIETGFVKHKLDTVSFGCRLNYYTGLYQYSNRFDLSYPGADSYVYSSMAVNVRYDVVLGYKNGTLILEIDGQYIRSYSNIDTNRGIDFLILGGNNGGSLNGGNCKMYYCKFFNDDVPVLDLVPCYRKADNIAGMYDILGGVFYEGYHVSAINPI